MHKTKLNKGAGQEKAKKQELNRGNPKLAKTKQVNKNLAKKKT